MPEAHFKCVVVRVGHGCKPSIAAQAVCEDGPHELNHPTSNRIESAILGKGTTGGRSRHDLTRLAETQAKRWIGGIRLQVREQTMTLRAHIAQAEHRIRVELALEREHIILRVRQSVVVEKTRRA